MLAPLWPAPLPGLAWPLWLNLHASDLHHPALLLACAPALALCLDRLLGEPAARWHPVVWMGHWLDWAGRRIAPLAPAAAPVTTPDTPPPPDWPRFVLGALAWLAGAALFTGAAWALQTWLLTQPPWLAALALGLFFKPLMAWRMLHDEVLATETALHTGGLPAARQQLARLVSRDTRSLSPTQVRESAIETLAENLNDSLIAPLLWFTLLGLPGAALYRYANTADAMWGYPGPHPLGGAPRQWAWAGKWAARADDALSWLPARISAALLCLTAPRRASAHGQRALRQLPAQAAQTPSPNSGWPMAATALLLDIRLGKPGSYTLHPQGRPPQRADLLQACALCARTAYAASALASLTLLALLLV